MRSAVFWVAWLSSSSAAFAQSDRRALESNRVTIECERAPIEQVVDRFRAASGLEMRIDATVRERLSTDDLRVTFQGRDLTVRAAMQAVLAPKKLAAVWSGDAVRILPRANLLVTEVYEVRDLLVVIRDFVPPPIGFSDPAAPTAKTFTLEEAKCTTVSDHWVVELVRTHAGGHSWEETEAAINLVNGLLIITQTRPIHREIRTLLDRLRRMK